jgi:hypothetical protein
VTRVVLTSFEPFGAVTRQTPRSKSASSSPAARPPDIDLDMVVLPVVAGAAGHQARPRVEQLQEALAFPSLRHRPADGPIWSSNLSIGRALAIGFLEPRRGQRSPVTTTLCRLRILGPD